jgi:methionyl-tRNA formyltransferase
VVVGVVVSEEPNDKISGLTAELDVDLMETNTLNGPSPKRYLRAKDVELGVCLGWYEVIEEDVLELPERGILGVHAAPLPEGRGQAPVNWQMIHDFEEATVSVFNFEADLDAGPIYAQHTVEILDDEDVKSLYDRLLYYGLDELMDVIEDLSQDDSVSESQSLVDATYWPRRRPADSLIDWHRSSAELERFVRALSGPYPTAFTFLKGDPVEIVQADRSEDEFDGKAGEILDIETPDRLYVQTSKGSLAIRRIGFRDSPTITGYEFADENQLEIGDDMGTSPHYPTDFEYVGLRGPEGRGQLKLKTNVEVGETATNNVYCFFPQKEKSVKILGTVGNTVVYQDEHSVSGHVCIPIHFTPAEPGSYFLRVRIGSQVERTTYIYAH